MAEVNDNRNVGLEEWQEQEMSTDTSGGTFVDEYIKTNKPLTDGACANTTASCGESVQATSMRTASTSPRAVA